MKPLPLLLSACLALALSGCVMVPSPYADQLKPAMRSYSSVKRGVPRPVLEVQLGKPTRVEPDGACVWETRFDAFNFASVKVWFDANNDATKVEYAHGHGVSAPGYQARAVTTRTK